MELTLQKKKFEPGQTQGKKRIMRCYQRNIPENQGNFLENLDTFQYELGNQTHYMNSHRNQLNSRENS